MAYNIIGNITEASRILILNESDLAIESNTTHSGGQFDVVVNDDNDKIIIARKNDGETFGYGGVTPILTGPLLLEDFTDGIGDWQLSEQFANATITWYNNNSMRLYANSSGGRGVDATWNTQVTGNFDVEFDFETTYHSTSGGDVTILTLMVGDDFDHIRYTVREASIGASVFLNAGGAVETEVPLATDVWTGKFRVVRNENNYIAYIDSGSGWEEKLNTEHIGWSSPFGIKTAIYVNSASMTTLIHSVTINSGTII